MLKKFLMLIKHSNSVLIEVIHWIGLLPLTGLKTNYEEGEYKIEFRSSRFSTGKKFALSCSRNFFGSRTVATSDVREISNLLRVHVSWKNEKVLIA